MHPIALSGATDFDGWRAAARSLLAHDVPPEQVEWTTGEETPGLFANDRDAQVGDAPADERSAFHVPAAFIDLCRSVILHSDHDRFALLYRLLWRLRSQRALLKVAVDTDVARAESMSKAVRHDIHKMRAFVRFREVAGVDGAPVYVAWFEPQHHIVEANASFFARRFTNRRWSILTPERSVHWDGKRLKFAPGAARSDAPDGDQLEDLWRTYYANIFNPARLKISAMQSEMPKKYWRNLPEAELIAPLIASARERTQQMIDEPPTIPPRRRMEVVAASVAVKPVGEIAAPDTLGGVRQAAAHCRQCPLWQPATQTVFGEGDEHARVMLVGEQAGDQEDLVGRPFVGPAGKLLDRALAEAGVDRAQLYVTNAVKHFKFESKGRRRIHKKPVDAEIDACYPWLAMERDLIKPSLIVALGATAARALTGRAVGIQANRGRITELPDGTKMMITVHPSYLLRVPEEDHPREYAHFVSDLEKTLPFLQSPPIGQG